MAHENVVVKIGHSGTTSSGTELKIPRMASIQAVANETGFSYKTLWRLCKEDRIVYIKSGNKYLINFDKFIDYLNTGEQQREDVNCTLLGV
ncbi:hypothetical protein ACH6CV_16405 [Bacillota bacterium Meth-B3]